jgi:hypothetical protein
LDLLAIIALEVTPFRAYAPFQSLLPSIECILQVVFFEGVQHRLRFFLDHLNCVKKDGLSFLSSIRETEM